MNREFQIIAGPRFHKWIRAFDELSGSRIPQAAVDEWNDAVEILFGATQQYAHVLSGDMVSSGRAETEVDGLRVIGKIIYGGGQRSNIPAHWKHQDIDYTIYELARGGNHDFIERAVTKTVPRLEEGAGKMIEESLREALR